MGETYLRFFLPVPPPVESTRCSAFPLQRQLTQLPWYLRPVRSDLVYSKKEVNREARLGVQMQMGVPAMTLQGIDFKRTRLEIWFKMQTGFRKRAKATEHIPHNLTELRRGEHGVL